MCTVSLLLCLMVLKTISPVVDTCISDAISLAFIFSDPPPSPSPPTIKCYPISPRTYYAEEGETSAVVQWTRPTSSAMLVNQSSSQITTFYYPPCDIFALNRGNKDWNIFFVHTGKMYNSDPRDKFFTLVKLSQIYILHHCIKSERKCVSFIF